MADLIAFTCGYVCPPALILTVFVFALARLRQSYKAFQEIEHRHYVPIEANDVEVPAKLNSMMEELRQRNFRNIGAFIEIYPTAKRQLRTPTIVFASDQFDGVATCALLPGRLGNAKIGALSTYYPDNKIVQTFYSLPTLVLTFHSKKSDVKTFRARNLEKALILHRKETENYSQQFGEALNIKQFDSFMDRFNAIDPDRLRQSVGQSLGKVFLLMTMLLGIMIILSILPLISCCSGLSIPAIVGNVIFSVLLALAFAYSCYHYLAVRRQIRE